MTRIVDQSPPVGLVAGRFAESAAYTTWRPHGTRDFLLILTTGGAGRFGYANGNIEATPGDLVIIRPGTPHDYATARGASGWELIWTHFLPRPEWNEWLAALPDAAPGITFLSLGTDTDAFRAVLSALESVNAHSNGGAFRARAFAANALEAALLHADAANPHQADRARFDERIMTTMERLRGDRLAVPVSLSDLAGAVYLSPSRLSHLFKAQTGLTPAQFQEAERVRRARELLTLTNRSVGAIAGEVGFASAFYFSLRFKKATGLSPRNFRNAAHQK